MSRSSVLFFVLLPAVLALGLPSGALAGGSQCYPNGAEAFMVGAAPPPGMTMAFYGVYYHADELEDSDGHDSKLLDHVTIMGDVFRFIWISKKQLLGGNYGQHFFLLSVDVDAEFNGPVGPKLGRDYHTTTVPYLIYSPFLLTWHLMQGKLHLVADLSDIYIPLYNVDNDNMASLGTFGRNYWTFEPVFAFTYLPTPAWELSAKFMYDISTTQEDYLPGPPVRVDRRPGDEFHVDFNLSYGITKALRLGLSGYYYRQVKDDDYRSIHRAPAPLQPVLRALEGEQGQVWALGPGVWYRKGRFIATLRSQWEFEAKNRPEGENVWLKVYYVF